MSSPSPSSRSPDWEAFYANFRRPGYVPGFVITSRIGGGASGLVFKATRQAIGRDHAIKFLKIDDAEAAAAVRRELELLRSGAGIDHPNLVAVEGLGEVDGIPYIVTAWAGTRTLRDLLPGGARDDGERLRLFLQVCRGVVALHEAGFVHFDLKPANVFLQSGVARVGDFGLSRLVVHGRGSLSLARGTPYYMAPELLQRRGDHRSDIYSLGVMLFELLTGSLPFVGDSEWAVFRQHEHAPVVVPDRVPPSLRTVIERCMRKDPAQRFQSVQDLVAVLRCIQLAEAPAAAPGARKLRDDLRRARSRPMILAGIFVASLASFLAMRVDAGALRERGFQRLYIEAMPDGPTASTVNGPYRAGSVHDAVRRLADSIELAARRRSTQLRLRPPDVPPPADLALYAEEVSRLLDAAVVSPMLQSQLEQLGHPFVLAAVSWLQECDYGDRQDCAGAARVMTFLQQATGITGLGVDSPVGDPDPATSRRFQAAADSWRHLLEDFAADSNCYRSMLAATGKLGGDRKN